MAMIAITTSSSIRVKPTRARGRSGGLVHEAAIGFLWVCLVLFISLSINREYGRIRVQWFEGVFLIGMQQFIAFSQRVDRGPLR
jgi:hypothetical protein